MLLDRNRPFTPGGERRDPGGCLDHAPASAFRPLTSMTTSCRRSAGGGR